MLKHASKSRSSDSDFSTKGDTYSEKRFTVTKQGVSVTLHDNNNNDINNQKTGNKENENFEIMSSRTVPTSQQVSRVPSHFSSHHASQHTNTFTPSSITSPNMSSHRSANNTSGTGMTSGTTSLTTPSYSYSANTSRQGSMPPPAVTKLAPIPATIPDFSSQTGITSTLHDGTYDTSAEDQSVPPVSGSGPTIYNYNSTIYSHPNRTNTTYDIPNGHGTSIIRISSTSPRIVRHNQKITINTTTTTVEKRNSNEDEYLPPPPSYFPAEPKVEVSSTQNNNPTPYYDSVPQDLPTSTSNVPSSLPFFNFNNISNRNSHEDTPKTVKNMLFDRENHEEDNAPKIIAKTTKDGAMFGLAGSNIKITTPARPKSFKSELTSPDSSSHSLSSFSTPTPTAGDKSGKSSFYLTSPDRSVPADTETQEKSDVASLMARQKSPKREDEIKTTDDIFAAINNKPDYKPEKPKPPVANKPRVLQKMNAPKYGSTTGVTNLPKEKEENNERDDYTQMRPKTNPTIRKKIDVYDHSTYSSPSKIFATSTNQIDRLIDSNTIKHDTEEFRQMGVNTIKKSYETVAKIESEKAAAEYKREDQLERVLTWREKQKLKEDMERQKLEDERKETARLKNELELAEMKAQEKIQKERNETEKLKKNLEEQERLEKIKLEQERLKRIQMEEDRVRKEFELHEKLEKERQEKEKSEREKIEKEKAENERLKRELETKEREKQEKIMQEKIQFEKKEHEMARKLQAEQEKLQKEQKEKELLKRDLEHKNEMEKLNLKLEEQKKIRQLQADVQVV